MQSKPGYELHVIGQLHTLNTLPLQEELEWKLMFLQLVWRQ
jgi:hypothetical protein